MDEKRLHKIDVGYRLRMEGASDEESEEIEFLAKLGLWALKHGIPALHAITRKAPGLVSREEAADMAMEFKMGATSALIAIPKDGA